MAVFSPTTSTYQNFHTSRTSLPLFLLSSSIPRTQFQAFSHSTSHSFFPAYPYRSFLPVSCNSRVIRSGRCRASSPGSPPPPKKDPRQLIGLPEAFIKFQDRVQIFFAVLFWMSLFFWSSVWDEWNRPNKGSRFRR
ncbi:Usher syndrome type-1C-binding protein 1 [Quillaja saponaria]|uniref:Usher syndrome type-1C-binding protein 1 n=1 Tax=Quillaja saponaria TaxID=32244 RepID=A0AAD7LRK1_QUISA|nr:Usher syndrome type-1C-binding protein 1 [Quillaja saponaria]